MNVMKITKELLNKTLTENGDVAYSTSLSYCLDYFSLIGGLRSKLASATNLFIKAYHEDRKKAIKLLFYTRDIRTGLGERRLFRYLLSYLASSNPFIATQLIKYIPEYGRYDDLLVLLNTPVEDEVVNFIYQQLLQDQENKKANKPISLLAKWMPSINTSNVEARQLALHLADKMNMTKKDYRQMLSFLRKGMIVENNLREKDYTFKYDEVPGLAMQKYEEAFLRNDEKRFQEYLKNLDEGKGKMNVNTMDVVSLVNSLSLDKDNTFAETAWKKLVDTDIKLNRRTIVVRDGSGSMTVYHSAIEIADAMTLLTAERLQGEFHNRFITFSSNPELVELSDGLSLLEKKLLLKDYDDYSNTDIQKVYELILKIYQHKDFKEEDALDQILIISDMEFDELDEEGDVNYESTFEYFDKKFSQLGYKRPQVIFWNVNARHIHTPVRQDTTGTILVSGQSKNIINMVVMNDAIDPLAFMNDTLKKYDFVDKLKWEE